MTRLFISHGQLQSRGVVITTFLYTVAHFKNYDGDHASLEPSLWDQICRDNLKAKRISPPAYVRATQIQYFAVGVMAIGHPDLIMS